MRPARRGRTRPGRLGLLEAYLARYEARLFGPGALCVEIGIGDRPWTVLDLASLAERTGARVVGVDVDAQRVRAARSHPRPNVEYRAGGFRLPLASGERPTLVRALNVLRGYPWAEALCARAAMFEAVAEGGLLVEGTSDARGHVLSAWLFRKAPASSPACELLLATDFGRGFAPALLRDHLPRDLRRSVRPGTAVGELFSQWGFAFEEARRGGATGPQEAFAASVQALAARRADVRTDVWLLANGMLVWCPNPGAPSRAQRG